MEDSPLSIYKLLEFTSAGLFQGLAHEGVGHCGAPYVRREVEGNKRLR